MTTKALRPPSLSNPSMAPSYSRAERAVDGWVHVAGLVAAPLAVAWLLGAISPQPAGPARTVALLYGAALLAMLSASAGYNLAPAGRAKALLRRLDHALIFVMIAATYTPFALLAVTRDVGLPLCATVWVLALSGAGLKLAGIGSGERVYLALYLALGWSFLLVLPAFVAGLSSAELMLLLGGGVLYTTGALIHARGSWRFHNAVWHALVLSAASLHFAALMRLLAA